MKINQGDWVILCDGAKALVLENVGDWKFPNLQTKEVYAHEDKQTHDQGTDAPGRSGNSVGTAMSAVEQTDWHAIAEQRFLQTLADRLDDAINHGAAKVFHVIAPPRALGIMRQSYSANVKKAVRDELDRDYVKLPVHEIEKHLAG